MDRRKFLAVGAAALLAGCDSQNDGTDTPTAGDTPGGADGTDNGNSNGNGNGNGTPAGTPTESPTPEPTLTPGGSGEFDPTVTWNSCTSFTIDAESYSTVFASLADGSVESFEEGYSGENTFDTSGPINSIEIYSDSGQYSAPNPDASACREN